ncbi:LytR C-terminal domain-containing protein [Streptomyces sp. NPDC021020]|uniref:LCP family protein n=1 Tax=Streptomyces sp. NPDC021020 TaxID=3365109 RepID=UPI0037A513F5
MSTEESGYIDPADQWVLDPETGTYQLRLDVPQQPYQPSEQQGFAPGGDAYGSGGHDGYGDNGGYGYGGHPVAAGYGGMAEPPAQDAYRAPEPPGYAPYEVPDVPAAYSGYDGYEAPDTPDAPPAYGGYQAPDAQEAPDTPDAEADADADADADAYDTGTQPPVPERTAPVPAPAPGGRRAARQAQKRRPAGLPLKGGPKVWGAAGAALLVCVVVGVATLGGGGGGGSMHTVDVGSAGSKTPTHTGAMNVLLLSAHPAAGSADSAVLVHLAADRGSATALAIPSTLRTDIPDCPGSGGKGTVGGAKGQPFSAALGGGRDAGCALLTVRQLTKLAVDHVVMVDYTAAKGVKGVAAGDTCVDRTVTVPRTLTALANGKPGALTADTPVGTPETLSNVAAALGAIDPKNTTFLTLPAVNGAPDPDKAPQVYALLANDVSLSAAAKPAAPDPKLVGKKAVPHETRVMIYNGTGVFGASQDVLAWLQTTQGVDRSTNGGDAHSKAAKTTLQYAPNQADQARSLAAMMGLPASALVEGTKDAAPKANMTLTLGADYSAPGVPVGPPTSAPKGVTTTPGTSAHC